MAERRSESDDPENLLEGFIVGVPFEQVVNGDGSVNIFSEGFVVAEDERAARKLVRAFEEETGSKVFHSGAPEKDKGPGTTFGFSRDRWNSSWEPRGPKPNWRVEPPADPSLN